VIDVSELLDCPRAFLKYKDVTLLAPLLVWLPIKNVFKEFFSYIELMMLSDKRKGLRYIELGIINLFQRILLVLCTIIIITFFYESFVNKSRLILKKSLE
jgi:hypothetical protein